MGRSQNTHKVLIEGEKSGHDLALKNPDIERLGGRRILKRKLRRADQCGKNRTKRKFTTDLTEENVSRRRGRPSLSNTNVL
jgi:hypothetical protein